MKVLVTGFDPFDKEKVNPAYEAVKLLPDKIADADIVKLEIPTVFSKSAEVVEDAIKKYNPDIVINVGQAGGRACVTVERVAINLAEARIPDNAGEKPMGTPIKEDGENAYFATVPVKAMVKNVRDHGFPCQISYTAGTYVCNSIMYNVLYMAAKKYKNIHAGFIHVPFSTEQAIDKPGTTPFMSLEQIRDCLTYAIEAAVVNKEDIVDVSGEIS